LEVAEVGEDSYRYVGNMGDLREKLKLNSRQTRISLFETHHFMLCLCSASFSKANSEFRSIIATHKDIVYID
jgi:hypothetical protein